MQSAVRERMGATGINWREAALGSGKCKRKTIGFGTYSKRSRLWSDAEIYIRELSIVDAGIGCAVWDAAILFSRWLLANHTLFEGSTVLELGSGCGLTGLCAAHYARHVYLTDYISQLLDNLKYNISLNASAIANMAESDIEEHTPQWRQFMSHDVASNTTVAYLNWDEIDSPSPTLDESVQPYSVPVPQCDIIIGSELTYSTHSVHTLSRVIQKYLAPGGVFYEVLSDDREGVREFVELIGNLGFTVRVHPVPTQYLGNYETNQRPETYHFYTFRRCSETPSTHPDMM
ncbi:Rossmann-fold protein [Pelomyxa schiedti]|nr:Rossmann-fold protein [Pelomyxa schiedti]